MSTQNPTIRTDFDRIAHLPERYSWSANDYYQPYLLKHLPSHIEHALEIGCGTGAFARQLATRSTHVTALDLSPEKVRLAQQRSSTHPNIHFQVADVLDWPFPSAHYDCIASIATLHHLSLDIMLVHMRDALKPGGTLLILDLVRGNSIADIFSSLLAAPLNFTLRSFHTQSLTIPAEVRTAWDEHGRTDTYPTIDEVKRACAEIIPGAKVKKHLMWRYSIVWQKEGRAQGK
jgi:SAM-dependent methyltransferase